MLLALDTSTRFVSVAAYDAGQHDTGQYDAGPDDPGQHDAGQHDAGQHDAGRDDPGPDEGVLAAATSDRPMQHGEQLAPLIDQVLEKIGAIRQDVSAVAVGVGPGPYTGLRVGVVTARVLGLALGIPVYGVCSLDVLAARAVDEGVSEPFVATLDARRKELFWAVYDETGRRLDGPHVDRPTGIPPELLVVGDGPVRYPTAFGRTGGPETPDAATLARVVAEERAELVDPEPIYLRRPDAAVPSPPKKVS